MGYARMMVVATCVFLGMGEGSAQTGLIPPDGSGTIKLINGEYHDWFEWFHWFHCNQHRFTLPPHRKPGYPVSPSPGEGGFGRTDRTCLSDTLRKVLASCNEPALKVACLTALARAEDAPGMAGLLAQMAGHRDESVAEAALLGYGIAGLSNHLEERIALMKGRREGTDFLDRKVVSIRLRSAATIGLALLANGTDKLGLKGRLFQAAVETIRGCKNPNEAELAANAVNLIGRLQPDLATPGGIKLARDAVTYLLSPGEDARKWSRVQAIVATSISTLLDPVTKDPSPPASWRGLEALRRRALSEIIGDLIKKENSYVCQALVMSLPHLARPADPVVHHLLCRLAKRQVGRSTIVSKLAHIAIGELGHPDATGFLLHRMQLRSGGKPWQALALAISIRRHGRHPDGPDTHRRCGMAMLNVLRMTKASACNAGIAIALGLIRFRPAGPDLLALLKDKRGIDRDHRSYYALSLALMGYEECGPTIRDLMRRQPYKLPGPFRYAMALKLLDRNHSQPRLPGNTGHAPTPPASSTPGDPFQTVILGYGGSLIDRTPSLSSHLCTLLADGSQPTAVRTFSAYALGNLLDHHSVPWQVRVASGIDYNYGRVPSLFRLTMGLVDYGGVNRAW